MSRSILPGYPKPINDWGTERLEFPDTKQLNTFQNQAF